MRKYETPKLEYSIFMEENITVSGTTSGNTKSVDKLKEQISTATENINVVYW